MNCRFHCLSLERFSIVNIAFILVISILVNSCGYHRIVSSETAIEDRSDLGDKPRSAAEKSLFELIESGDVQNLKTRIEGGESFDQVNSEGQSLLMWAIVWNQKNVIEFLLNTGVDVDHRDNQGKTVFDYREIGGELVDFIEAWQMRGELQKEFKLALISAKYKTVSELLELGVDPGVRYEEGATALILVIKIADPSDRGAYRNFRRVIQALLKLDTHREPVYNVDLNAKDDFGKSALDWAKEKRDRSLVKNLEMIGAE